jgi:hypothetical protein
MRNQNFFIVKVAHTLAWDDDSLLQGLDGYLKIYFIDITTEFIKHTSCHDRLRLLPAGPVWNLLAGRCAFLYFRQP